MTQHLRKNQEYYKKKVGETFFATVKSYLTPNIDETTKKLRKICSDRIKAEQGADLMMQYWVMMKDKYDCEGLQFSYTKAKYNELMGRYSDSILKTSHDVDDSMIPIVLETFKVKLRIYNKEGGQTVIDTVICFNQFSQFLLISSQFRYSQRKTELWKFPFITTEPTTTTKWNCRMEIGFSVLSLRN